MKRKCTRILCMVLSVMMVVSLLPLTVSAACSHNYKKVYTIENEKMHSYKSECSKCGTVTEGWGYAGWEDHSYNSSGECTACGHCKHSETKTTYSYENSNMHSYVTNCRNCEKQISGGWEDHTFSGNDCTRCDYTKACSHTNSKTTYTDYTSSQHKRASKCRSCGITYNTTTESHDWEYGDWEASSSTKHEREKSYICGRSTTESESHDFRNNTCRDCGYTKTTVSASVSLSASGPSGDTSGTSTSQTYSQTYTASSKPLKVTFYCYPEKVDDTDPPEDDDPIIDDPVVDDPVVTTGEVTIYVRDASTYALLSSAYVSGSGCGGYTNRYGYVSFEGLELGRHTFTASKSGYYSNSGSVRITASDTSPSVTIYLTPIEEEEEVEITGSIRVYVRDSETNALISGATVSGAGSTKTTNSSGYTTFSSLSPGTYSFTAAKTGYESGSGSTTLNSSGTRTLTIYLTPEEVLPTTGDITVYVRDANTNSLISGASVSGGGYSGTTNSSGKVTFSSIPFGSYPFTASKTGYSPGSGSASVSVSDTTDSITIYLDKNDADVGITAKNVNGTVYRGSTIIVSAEVTGDSNIDSTPSNPLSVTMSAVMNEGEEFDSQTKSVICPKAETNLVWFIVEIPETGYTDPDVTFTFTVDMPSGYSDSTDSNNESSKTVTTYILPTRTTPDPSFELDAPADFTGSVYKTSNTPELTWSVWEWDGGFTEKEYSAELTVSAKLKPDDTAVWKQYNSSRDQWTTRSGYGLNTEVEVDRRGRQLYLHGGA